MRKLSAEAIDALKAIAASNNGLLQKSAVLDAARDPGSPLHEHFTWDQEEASAKWLLVEAGLLIRRVKVERAIDEDHVIKYRVYHSLASDRLQNGGGYRTIDAIMSDDHRKAELLRTALKELANFKRRYSVLSELTQLTAAIDEVLAEAAA
jgi:hypothetical protein